MLARLICFLFGHDAQIYGAFHMIEMRYPVGHPLEHEKISFEVCKRCGELARVKR